MATYDDSQIIYASATTLTQAMRAREVSSEEVVEAYLHRIEAINPKLNAVVQLAAEEARTQARTMDAALRQGDVAGPLHGLPVTIKDSLDTAGMITTAGTTGRATFVPQQDATVVARLRAAGAIILGKTNTPEICLAPNTDNLVYGQTNNPYDVTCIPGGSSGGEAAIIAAGGSPLGIGTDTFGSIRWPCHCCGIAGLKPTSGRVPRTGDVLAFSLGAIDAWSQIGPMARSVADLSLTLPILAGPDGCDPGISPVPLGDPHAVALERLRIAFYSDNGLSTPIAAIEAALQTVVERLAHAGLSVQHACPPALRATLDIVQHVWDGDGRAGPQRLLDKLGTREVSPPLRSFLQGAQPIPSSEFNAWLNQMNIVRQQMLAFMEAYDVILCPVNCYPALPHDQVGLIGRASISHTIAYNLTGWPAVVVRAGTTEEGLPIGVQIVARPWREEVALAVAQLIEQALGGWQPPRL